MIVVADSSPLHYLILIDQIDVLRQLYGEVIIPDAVAHELQSAKSPPTVRDWISTPPSWAAVRSASPEQIAAVTETLDLGERAAIAIAGAIAAELLLIDDAAGRAEAKRRNLRVTGTVGVLRVAAELGAIDVPEILMRLRATSFYVDDTLIDAVFGRWLRS